MKKIELIIEVRGGVAEWTNQDNVPGFIQVLIIDHDNREEEDEL